ncbi:hypothetical protein [Macrococcus sp. DPC7161]|nr:hypothetical protein [Macrococcus sp. DPC7161]
MYKKGDVVIYEDEKYTVTEIYYEMGYPVYLQVDGLDMLLFMDEVKKYED